LHHVTKMSPESHQDSSGSVFSSTLEEHAMDSPRRNPTLFAYRGKWRITYSDHLGKNRSKTVASQREGYIFIAELERGNVEPGRTPGRTPAVIPTVEQWLTTWLKLRSQELSLRTQFLYRSVFTIHVVPVFGHLRCSARPRTAQSPDNGSSEDRRPALLGRTRKFMRVRDPARATAYRSAHYLCLTPGVVFSL
jgi:hypothetical protein